MPEPIQSETQTLEELAERFRVSKGRRAATGLNPRVDALLGMVMAMTSEIAVLRSRLDVHERLAAAGRVAKPESVENYRFSEEEEKQRAEQQARLIRKVCRPLIADSS